MVRCDCLAPSFFLPPLRVPRAATRSTPPVAEGVHLLLDFFQNDWMLQVDAGAPLPVPELMTTAEVWDAAKVLEDEFDRLECPFRQACGCSRRFGPINPQRRA